MHHLPWCIFWALQLCSAAAFTLTGQTLHTPSWEGNGYPVQPLMKQTAITWFWRNSMLAHVLEMAKACNSQNSFATQKYIEKHSDKCIFLSWFQLGQELIFITASGTMLCFSPRTKTTLITRWCFNCCWAVLYRATVVSAFQCLVSSCQQWV